MKTELTHISGVKKRLAVVVPASDVLAAEEHILRRQRAKARIPGFRPGKAPLAMIKARLGEELHHELAEKLVEDFGREGCRRENLAPIHWDIELPEGTKHLPHPVDGQEYSFTLVLEVLPEIEPKDYRGQEVARPAAQVEVEDVQREMEALRQAQGKLVDVVDRASGDADFVGVEIQGVELGGDARIEKGPRVFRLGDQRRPPEFDQALKDRRVGEEFTFEVKHPADYPDPKLAGRIVTFSGVVKTIQKPDIPEWSDDLARATDQSVKDLADLRERVRQLLVAHKEAESDQVARRRLMDKILAANPFEAPPSLVEEELRERLSRVGRQLAARGVDLEKAEIDWRRIADEERVRAEQEVRERLLLDRIAEVEAEHVVVEGADVDRVVDLMARDMNTTPAKLRRFMEQEKRLPSLRAEVKRTKCLDWLYSVAHIS